MQQTTRDIKHAFCHVAAAFDVCYQGVYEFQNILFVVDIPKGVVLHGFFEVNRIYSLYFGLAALQELSTFDQNCFFSGW